MYCVYLLFKVLCDAHKISFVYTVSVISLGHQYCANGQNGTCILYVQQDINVVHM